MRPYPELIEELKKIDPVLKDVHAEQAEEFHPTPSIDVYFYLQHSIVSQQLSTKVAEIIWQRYLDLFPERYPEPEMVLQKSDGELRGIGLSFQKLGYMRNVADFSLEYGMEFDMLDEWTDDEIIKYLTQIKGVGKWTVQMILMFPMDRPNVFPVDDLGIQTKMKKYYNINLEKKELRQKLVEISDRWDPYKTVASKLLWSAR
ncbi:MAG: DNA-3-methyladenine glycosylase 2 family protein [Crocinitomicaceae bacterium]|nr:DNA-3-methyladenine glycosylase 2 family protein [Crocinitomicaceae bacterium]